MMPIISAISIVYHAIVNFARELQHVVILLVVVGDANAPQIVKRRKQMLAAIKTVSSE